MKITSTISSDTITVTVDPPMPREPMHAAALGAIAGNLYEMGRSKGWIMDFVRIAVERVAAAGEEQIEGF